MVSESSPWRGPADCTAQKSFELAWIVRRVDRVREPGKLSSYSNYGVGLAGAALEHLDGRPWQDIIEERILEPVAYAPQDFEFVTQVAPAGAMSASALQ